MDSKQHFKIKDFEILIEKSGYQNTNEIFIQPSDEVIGFVYYLNGEVLITIKSGKQKQQFHKRKGIMSSFYSHQENEVIQEQVGKNELQKVSIFFSRQKLKSLIEEDEHLKKAHQNLTHPSDFFVSGKNTFIRPNISFALEQVINNQFTGVTKNLFLEGQIIGLLANYFSITSAEEKKNPLHIEKLHYAKEILLEQMDAPPSLNELSKLTGLNTFKLKTGFKELFGLPVFKYLQEKRLEKAFELIENNGMNIQEVAWFVGYESLGSFSNAFKNKFGIRPTDIK